MGNTPNVMPRAAEKANWFGSAPLENNNNNNNNNNQITYIINGK
jgi:hypothetical protein